MAFGSTVLALQCPVHDTSIIAHSGTPRGEVKSIDGVNMYISKPGSCNEKSNKAILYLSDVFGIQLMEQMLLIDSFARAGYLVVAPDMFNGTPANADIDIPTEDAIAFLEAHPPNVTEPIIAKAMGYLRGTLGTGRVGITGYCFGGRLAFWSLGSMGGATPADVGFTAHPSLLEDAEILGIKGPMSVAFAEHDFLMTHDRQTQYEVFLPTTGQKFQYAQYGGTSHGYAVRANISDPVSKFGKESAFLQAVRWFDAWL